MLNNELLGFEWKNKMHGAKILNLTYWKGQVTSRLWIQ